MRRTQILLEDNQYKKLKQAMFISGKSLSEIVRLCISTHLSSVKKDPLFRLVGAVKRDEDHAPVDLSEKHDEYLYGRKR